MPTTTSPLDGLDREIDALRDVGGMLWQRGWSVGTSSNYSVVIQRDPVELLVTASGMDKGRLGPGDFVRVDAAGKPVAPDQPKSSAETMLHVMLARLPNVGAVLHTHSVWGTVLSQHFHAEGGFVIRDFEMLKGLAGVSTHVHDEWVPIYDNTQDIPKLAAEVEGRSFTADAPPIHGFLIRHHGLYTWGETLEDAHRHIEIFEFLFECVAREIRLAD